jgi:hypothetical protein
MRQTHDRNEDASPLTEGEQTRFERYASEIFSRMGLDCNSPGGRDTPRRWVLALWDMTEGYDGDPKLSTLFPVECPICPDGAYCCGVAGIASGNNLLRSWCGRQREVWRRRCGGNNLDSGDGGIVDHRYELNGVLSVRVCIDREFFDHRLVLGAGSGKDIEVRQHLCAIDRDVEYSLAGSGPVVLRKMKAYGMRRVRGKIGERIGKFAEAARLVDGHRRRVGHGWRVGSRTAKPRASTRKKMQCGETAWSSRIAMWPGAPSCLRSS